MAGGLAFVGIGGRLNCGSILFLDLLIGLTICFSLVPSKGTKKVEFNTKEGLRFLFSWENLYGVSCSFDRMQHRYKTGAHIHKI